MSASANPQRRYRLLAIRRRPDLASAGRLVLLIVGMSICATVATWPIQPAFAKDGGGDGGGHGGSGSSGGGSSGHGGGDDGGGGDSSGHGRSGSDDNSGKGKDGQAVDHFLNSLKSRGTVAWSSVRDGAVEVRYADGWSENAARSGYTLRDPRANVVVSRPARQSDFDRLEAAAR